MIFFEVLILFIFNAREVPGNVQEGSADKFRRLLSERTAFLTKNEDIIRKQRSIRVPARRTDANLEMAKFLEPPPPLPPLPSPPPERADLLGFLIPTRSRRYRKNVENSVSCVEEKNVVRGLKVSDMVKKDVEGGLELTITRVPRCAICDISFRFDTGYVNHCAREHGIAQPYQCGKCDKMFGKKCSLQRHYATNPRCLPENDPFTAKARNNTTYTCRVCNVHILGLVAYERHAAAAHKGVPMLKCGYCDATFYYGKTRTKHENKMHGSSSFRCKFCGSLIERSDVLAAHQAECELASRGSDKMGTKEVKSALYERTYSEESEAIYACDHCHKSFTTTPSLKLHERTEHAIEKGGEAMKFPKIMEQYTCPHCGDEFAGSTQYQKHGHLVHPGEKMFHCDECGEGFTKKSSADRHLRETHGDNKLPCPHCSKCYYRMDKFREHKLTCRKRPNMASKRSYVRGTRPYFCNICRKWMHVMPDSFTRHITNHDDYIHCPICEVRFHRVNNPRGLWRHMRLRHPLLDNINALLETANMERIAAAAVTKAEELDGKKEEIKEGKNGEEGILKYEKE